MSYRFKPSKYKNAVPQTPKKEEHVTSAPVHVGKTYGSAVAASAALMAFVTKNRGGASVAVLPLTSAGRYDATVPLLDAHASQVTDLCFSPFDDGLLATGSADCKVCVWSLPEDGCVPAAAPAAEVQFSTDQRRVDTLQFHPTADCLLTASFGQSVRLYDILHQHELHTVSSHDAQVLSVSWCGDGTRLATTCRDAALRIFDPRTDRVAALHCQCTAAKSDSRVVWLGGSDQLITSGFNASRERQLSLRDIRNLSEPLTSLRLNASSGVIVPLYDRDTRMLFLVDKGSVSVRSMEVGDQSPYFTDGQSYVGEEVKDMCLVPKRALRVLTGEVNRLIQLTSSSIVPVSYAVTRKVSGTFHADLYPDTCGCDPAVSASQWWSGDNRTPRLVSLDPDKVTVTDLRRFGGGLKNRQEPPKPVNVANQSAVSSTPVRQTSDSNKLSLENEEAVQSSNGKSAVCLPQTRSNLRAHGQVSPSVAGLTHSTTTATTAAAAAAAAVSGKRKVVRVASNGNGAEKSNSVNNNNGKTTTKLGGRAKSFRRVNKCRYMSGKAAPQKQHITNIRNLNQATTNECNAISVNKSFAAISLSGIGGRVTILNLDRPGRLPDGVTPCLLNGAKVTDFAFDPFDDHSIAVAGDDGCVRLWRVPDAGLTDQTNEPAATLTGHSERVLSLAHHPLAQDVLATTGLDRRLLIWCKDQQQLEMEPLPDQVMSLAWSPCGRYLAALCRDAKLRVFEPRAARSPVQCADSHQGTRGGRVLYCLGGRYLVSSGSDKQCKRQLFLYRADDVQCRVASLQLDSAPALFMCHYDEGTSTLFLFSKGGTSILGYEIAQDAPYFFALAPYDVPDSHQAVAFVSKHLLDVRAIEFARCFRLLPTALVPVSFTVPRVKPELFQDDLFPPTAVTWTPALSGREWLQGANVSPQLMELCPPDMQPLSSHKAEESSTAVETTNGNGADHCTKRPGHHSQSSFAPRPDFKKAFELECSLSNAVKIDLEPRQDATGEVDDSEW